MSTDDGTDVDQVGEVAAADSRAASDSVIEVRDELENHRFGDPRPGRCRWRRDRDDLPRRAAIPAQDPRLQGACARGIDGDR